MLKSAVLSMDKIGLQLVTLISNSNMEGWVRDYDFELFWIYQDGTRISSFATEHDNVGSWLELYDELPEKIVAEIDNISFSDPDIEEVLGLHGNLLEFKFKLNFEGSEIIYHYIQYGEGNEAAQLICIPSEALKTNFYDWLSDAIKNDWCVTLSD